MTSTVKIEKQVASALTGVIMPQPKVIQSQWGYPKDECVLCGVSCLQRGGYIQHFNRVHKLQLQVEAIILLIKALKLDTENE